MSKPVGSKKYSKAVPAERLVELLAQTAWIPQGKRRTNRLRERDQAGSEALPSGHPISWAALWPADATPRFPGLRSIGAWEPGMVRDKDSLRGKQPSE
ncbi:hypothetical protein ABUE34_05090 [Kozakia baliensis]|uniref:hypothetical protein n=1 Tax=Kozakia baliensis TaxID=153496 RepID=UPI00345B4D90